MILSLIVAMAKNRVIGVNNQLPWKIPEDLKRFKTITMGHPIIMGRKTFESIGKPLLGRKNIVLSRNHFNVSGIESVQTLDQAIEKARTENSDECFIIGGAQIYEMALPRVQRLYLTLIDQEVAGDAYFPKLNMEDYIERSNEARDLPVPYRFVLLERK